jgi:hypothetical protein
MPGDETQQGESAGKIADFLEARTVVETEKITRS